MNQLYRLGSCAILGTMVLLSCSRDKGDGNGGVTISLSQQSSATEQTGAQVQEAVEAIEAVESSTSATGVAADNAATAPSVTCTPSAAGDGKVTVQEVRDYEVERTAGGRKITRKITQDVNSTRTRVWTPPTGGAAITCNLAKRAAISWSNSAAVNGLSMEASIDDSKAGTVALSGTLLNGQTLSLTLNRNTKAKGKRTVTHSDLEVSASTLTMLRTVSSNVTRTDTGTRFKEGSKTETESYTLSHENSTAEGAPLKIRTVMDRTTFNWTRKTIESGTFKSKNSDSGQTVESTFANVVFTAESCLPSAGTITGQVLDNSGAKIQSFVITFGANTDSEVSISYDGGEALDFPTAADYSQSCSYASWTRKS